MSRLFGIWFAVSICFDDALSFAVLAGRSEAKDRPTSTNGIMRGRKR